MTQTFEGHAADGDDVGCHEGDGGEREHGVEGDGAADVDQGHDDGEGAGEDDAVHGDVPGVVDLREASQFVCMILKRIGMKTYVTEPFGKGKTVVASERECLPRG
jgi:hypothetical protein